MIDANFVQKIADLAPTTAIKIGDETYFTRPVHNAPIPEEPAADTLQVATLEGLVEFYKTQHDTESAMGDEGWLIHVFSPWRVYLVSQLKGAHRVRDTYVKARFDEGTIFPFSEWMDHATFMLKLQTKFFRVKQGDGTTDIEKLMKIMGTIKSEQVKTSVDDGIGQRVVAVAGTAVVEEVTVPNQLMLQPFRTFPEVDQPESLFVVRLQQGRAPGEMPRCALFEVDEGRWCLEAVANLRDYFEKALPDVPVLA